ILSSPDTTSLLCAFLPSCLRHHCELRHLFFNVILLLAQQKTTLHSGGYMALTKKAQEIVDYMTDEREKFLATAQGLSEVQLNFKPAAEQWSIREIFHHIWMVEGLTARLMANLLKQAVENNLPEDADSEASVVNSLDAYAE